MPCFAVLSPSDDIGSSNCYKLEEGEGEGREGSSSQDHNDLFSYREISGEFATCSLFLHVMRMPNQPSIAGRDKRECLDKGGRDSEADHRRGLDDAHRLRAIRDQDHPFLDRRVTAFKYLPAVQ